LAAVSAFVAQVIQYLYQLTALIGLPSYGLAIFFLTLTIKLILFPLTRTQVKSMQAMQAIQPEMQKIQKKYKNNPQKQQEEMIKLYQKAGANPMAGCLPLLIQLPIILALFTGIRDFFTTANPLVDITRVGFLWIHNLGVPDPYYILPIIAVVATYFQQKVSTPPGPQQSAQKAMLYVMPLMMGYFTTKFPAGLALYWVYYSLLTILEQWLIRRELPVAKEEVSKAK